MRSSGFLRRRNVRTPLPLRCSMQTFAAAMHSPVELKVACLSLRLESFQKHPSTALVQEAGVGVKWNVQLVRPFSHSSTKADLQLETLSRTT